MSNKKNNRKNTSFYGMVLLAFIVLSLGCQTKPASTVNEVNAPVLADTPAVVSQTDTTPETDFLMGKFDPARHADFVKVSSPHTAKAGMMLQKSTYEAFKKMYTAAKKEGVELLIISSTRTFEQQKGIWEGKWARFAAEKPDPTQRALKILEYSSMPGSSRHHWGTDMDLNDLNNSAFEGNGRHKKVYDWLVAHAHEYGFGQPYTPIGSERPHGYHEEKWHWSYLPLSKKYRQQFLNSVKDSDISGFKGSETASKVNAVAHYVGGVDKKCQ
jgi:zinc D-Ala-D-Ala carboxypeptidase